MAQIYRWVWYMSCAKSGSITNCSHVSSVRCWAVAGRFDADIGGKEWNAQIVFLVNYFMSRSIHIVVYDSNKSTGFGPRIMLQTETSFCSGLTVCIQYVIECYHLVTMISRQGGPGCSSLEGFLQENGPICKHLFYVYYPMSEAQYRS